METVESVQTRCDAHAGDYLQLLRPTQWVKNVVVFAGPAAGLKLLSPSSLVDAMIAFAAFCAVASAGYAINDAVDRKADASHPTKRNRAVARGAIKPATAVMIGVLLLILATGSTAMLLDPAVTFVLGAYFVMTLAYSLALKRRVILDVIIIATGFVLRAWAGSLAVGVTTSEWLVACMFTLCLFMGFGKRRCELAMIGNIDDAGRHRPTLLRYTPDLLNHLITVSAGIAVMTFLLYTLDTSRSPSPFPREHLFYTLPIVVYGVFRFAMLTETGLHSGPTEIVLKDKAILVTVLLWTAAALAIAYQDALFGPAGLTPWLSLSQPSTG
ncbi:MAG: decaprenyl-phosphate phosphoribosyltransferase [Planctomycetes bacterium]|nr:decaprenyl-phosphate phosphoribosyltransferase [Planctomycetota bacterium]